MKKLILVLLLIIPFLSFAQDPNSVFIPLLSASQDTNTLVHDNTHYIDDFADIIKPDDKLEIERIVKSFWDTVQISVVTVKSLQGMDVMDYAIQLGNKWGVGGKSDNGVLLLIAPNEHKYATATGKGVQGDLTDIFTARESRNILVPAFRAGDYGSGIINLLNAYISEMSPSAKNIRKAEEEKEAEIHRKIKDNILTGFLDTLFIILLIIPLVYFIRIYIKKERKRKKEIQDTISEAKDAYKEISILTYRAKSACDNKISEGADLLKSIEVIKDIIPTTDYKDCISYLLIYKKFISNNSSLINGINSKLLALKTINFHKERLTYIDKILDNLTKMKINSVGEEYSKLQTVRRNLSDKLNTIDGELNSENVNYDLILVTLGIIKNYIKYDDIIDKCNKILADDSNKLLQAKNAKSILQTEFNKPLKWAQLLKSNSNNKLRNIINGYKQQLTNFDNLNDIEKYKLFEKMIGDFDNDVNFARIEYEKENNRIIELKRKEEEEERLRRLSSYNSSSSSSWSSDNSSSWGSDSSFGGGSFDGGGSSGSW